MHANQSGACHVIIAIFLPIKKRENLREKNYYFCFILHFVFVFAHVSFFVFDIEWHWIQFTV